MQDVLNFGLSLAQSCLRHPPLRAHAAVLAATTVSAATAVRLAVPLQAMKGLMEHIDNDAGGEVSIPSGRAGALGSVRIHQQLLHVLPGPERQILHCLKL